MLETIIYGLSISIIGIGVVFLILVGLSYMLDLFKIFSVGPKPKNIAPKKEEPVKKEEPQIVEEVVDQTDDLELVAVITAAIAASLGTTSDQLRVRSLRRVTTTQSVWNMTGRKEQIQNSL